MDRLSFGRTYFHVFPIGLRTLQLGGFDWGDVDPVIVVIPVLVMPLKLGRILRRLQQTFMRRTSHSMKKVLQNRGRSPHSRSLRHSTLTEIQECLKKK